MNTNPCVESQALFSGYLDGAVSGVEMQSVSAHLAACEPCAAEFETLRGTQAVLASLGQTKAPTNLGLKLRVAISHESARRRSNWLEDFGTRWDNVFRPLVVQASMGFAGAVFLVGSVAMLLGVVATPNSVLANDEPLGALTAPHYRYSVAQPQAIATQTDTTIVVEAEIDATGRVYDYKIVSGPTDAATRAQVMAQLLIQIFEPAKVFGEPVKSRAVVTFEGLSVRG